MSATSETTQAVERVRGRAGLRLRPRHRASDDPRRVQSYIGKLRSGDPGALPSVLGLVVLVLIFMQVSDRFLTKSNIGNLPGQGAYIAVIGMGLVFVLLLGEIDLSAGTCGGMCAAFAARSVFSGDLHQAWPSFLYWSLIVGMLGAVALAVVAQGLDRRGRRGDRDRPDR